MDSKLKILIQLTLCLKGTDSSSPRTGSKLIPFRTTRVRFKEPFYGLCGCRLNKPCKPSFFPKSVFFSKHVFGGVALFAIHSG